MMSAAERQKRHRSRQAQGITVVPVEVDAEILNELEAAGLLADENSANRAQVGLALAEALRRWASSELALRVTQNRLGLR